MTGGKFLGILGKLFTTRKAFLLTTTVIFSLILLGIPLYHSIREGSIRPFTDAIGQTTLGIDGRLQESTQTIINEGVGFNNMITLLGCLWFYFIIIRGVYWFWDKMSIHGQVIVVFISILTIGAAQAIYMTSMTKEFYMPLQGLWFFITHINTVLDPAINKVEQSGFTNLTV